MRLQKFLALCGCASRRAAENLITDGRVCVNGVPVTTLGTKIDPEADFVTVDQKPVTKPEEKVYIMLNKPAGYVTTAKDNFNRQTVLDLIPDSLGRLYPVGRLDYDTQGLLLLTNDGELTNRLTHPRHQVNKTYLALVAGFPSNEDIEALQKGVMIDGKKTQPAKVIIVGKTENATKLSITIHEGRNRQVRKMCAAIGHATISLTRIAEGPIKLGDLALGSWRHLTEDEVRKLGGTTHADH
ncbi:MAG: rRNA pseudouridine synthase [Ruminococcaceae bacterium]|nr:rRNA pseudouridine synthase [Oscillospiraceae bacterium]